MLGNPRKHPHWSQIPSIQLPLYITTLHLYNNIGVFFTLKVRDSLKNCYFQSLSLTHQNNDDTAEPSQHTKHKYEKSPSDIWKIFSMSNEVIKTKILGKELVKFYRKRKELA